MGFTSETVAAAAAAYAEERDAESRSRHYADNADGSVKASKVGVTGVAETAEN